jgi:diadenosine tetraphosphate (Ap4A) HIT family hydrolase
MFALHDGLARDTFALATWSLSRVLLMNDSAYPWLILVPEREGARDLVDLAARDRSTLIEECARASSILRTMVKPDKLNVAALGNVVPQLHVHVIARFTSDPAWPKPIWGVRPPTPYGEAARADFKTRFDAAAAANR